MKIAVIITVIWIVMMGILTVNVVRQGRDRDFWKESAEYNRAEKCRLEKELKWAREALMVEDAE